MELQISKEAVVSGLKVYYNSHMLLPIIASPIRECLPRGGSLSLGSSSVVDPNRLCSDPDPTSHVHSDPDPALEPNRIRIRSDPDPDPAYIFHFVIFVKILFLVLKFSLQLILKTVPVYMYSKYRRN